MSARSSFASAGFRGFRTFRKQDRTGAGRTSNVRDQAPVYRLRFLAAQKTSANGNNAAVPQIGETGLDEGLDACGLAGMACDGAGVAVAGRVVIGAAVSNKVGRGVGVSVSQMKS